MPRKLYHVQLTVDERTPLEMFVKQGKKSARAITRARILLLLDAGCSHEDMMDTLGVCRQTVYSVQKKYHAYQGTHILELLQEKPRPGPPVKVDSRRRSACSHDRLFRGTSRQRTLDPPAHCRSAR